MNRYEKEVKKRGGSPVKNAEERLKKMGGSLEQIEPEKRNPEKMFYGLGAVAKAFFRKLHKKN